MDDARPEQAQPWLWDESLYAGSAPHYPRGRVAYPPGVAAALRAELGLDGSGRLLDVGCGPGAAALALAGEFAEVVGVDADADMLAEAARQAELAGVGNVRWVKLRAEQLPAGLGIFDVAVFAQSFHWMDRPRVARITRSMLTEEGAWVLVFATTHRGVSEPGPMPFPAPPWARIGELVGRYLGPVRRAGRGTLPRGTASGEAEILDAAGFGPVDHLVVPGGSVEERSVDQVVAAVFSLSSSAPHLFGERLAGFEADLRDLLHSHSAEGRFCEQAREIDLAVYRPNR